MKAQRWYEIVDGMAYIYDHPIRDKAIGMSVVSIKDLTYYRSNFNLCKVWK